MFANKRIRQLIIIGFSVLATVVIVLLTLDYSSYKSISFNMSTNVSSAVIYSASYPEDGASAKITTLSSSATVRLKPGTYYITPTGENIVTDTYEITVDRSTTNIDINPYYSDSYLSSNFTDELTSITSVLKSAYPAVGSDYSLGEGHFYHFGDWYGASLYKSPDANGAYDFYGVILHKMNGSWGIAAPPKLIFSYSSYPEIPKDIIYAVNSIVNGF